MTFTTRVFSQKTGLPEKYFEGNASYDPTNVDKYHDLHNGDRYKSPPEEYEFHANFALDALKLFPKNVQKIFINSCKAINLLNDSEKDPFINATCAYLIDEEYKMRDSKSINIDHLWHPL